MYIVVKRKIHVQMLPQVQKLTPSDSSGRDDENTFRWNQRLTNYHSTFYVHVMHLYMRLYLCECRGVFECGGEV